jgi:hypothetical protein
MSTDDDRVLAIAAPSLLPLLELRQAQTLSKLLGAYATGGELRDIVGEYAVYTTLIKDITTKLKLYSRGEN